MPVTYDYSKSPVRTGRLTREIIAAGLVQPEGTTWNGNDLTYNLHITFTSELSTGDKTTLDAVVAAHNGATGTYVPPAGGMGVSGCRLVWGSASTVKIGRAGVVSRAGDANGDGEIAFTGRLTVDLTVSGANGLDTGSAAASTWYAVYVIADSTGLNEQAGLFSLSAVSPTLPAGYDKFRRIGWVKTGPGTTGILVFYCQGEDTRRQYVYDVEVGSLQVLSGGNATSWTTLNLSAYMPSTAEIVQFSTEVIGATINTWGQVRPYGSSVTDSVFRLRTGPTKVAREIWYMPAPSQKVDYKVKASGDSMDLWITGFVDDI